MSMTAEFIDAARGKLFVLLHTPPPGVRVRGCVLYVHPFAEEHNKSRRMAANQARAWAEDGFLVAMPDLFGCGDSEGDFGDADWAGWLDDVRHCADWLQRRHAGPLILWGLRGGCLLIGEACAVEPRLRPAATVFWQPVVNGELFLMQFLRLRMASGMLAGERENTRALRARLEAGESLEVAGYRLAPALASGLAVARLQPPVSGVVHWFELAASPDATLPPASRNCMAEWQARAVDVRSAICTGEPFWATQEIREAPALIEQTRTVLQTLALEC